LLFSQNFSHFSKSSYLIIRYDGQKNNCKVPTLYELLEDLQTTTLATTVLCVVCERWCHCMVVNETIFLVYALEELAISCSSGSIKEGIQAVVIFITSVKLFITTLTEQRTEYVTITK